MEFLDTVKGWFAPVWDFFEPGLIAYAGDGAAISWMPLAIQLGVIALVLTILMRSFGAILIFTVVGVIIHVIVDVVMPMVREGAAFAMPPFMADGGVNMVYLGYLAALAAGYFLAIIVLSILKGLVFRGD
ncbi:hypothetical protein [Hyphobacterium marinum]|uniref:DoxX family protein n=1 Tax=Hyphobacterium marinum TaxID=3116574 RepID=A0ABU7LZ52_9PROT|nr:hypothetical protein [Hyphobacterium sp. Y6023]MEE2566810.1 hypothetical protein [Hyphobacterium sp. Y6023]